MSDAPVIAEASPDVITTEMARRKALAAMGIDVYTSCFDFPGAATADRLVLPIQDPNQLMNTSRSNDLQLESPSSLAQQAPQSGDANVASRALSGQSKLLASQSVSFSMLLASAGPFLWLEELPDGLIRQDQLALVNAMARAISPCEAQLIQQQFDWPVQGKSALSGDTESAKQALHGLIQRMAREADAKRVILMGDCNHLPDRIIQSGVQIPSTLAMLSDHRLKRAAWEALKPLKSLSLA